jgi:hypothetical protein
MSAHYVKSNIGVPIGWWRSIGHSQNAFFVESFIDELAHAAGVDPLAFRREHLQDNPRGLAVLEKVAEMASWGQPTVPGAAHGLAFVTMAGSILAQIAEVSVGLGDKVKVHKVYCVIDCGLAVNPDIIKAQIEGGILFGLTAALHGEITIENGRVQQSNYHDYHLITLRDAPVVETLIITSDSGRGGVGEVGVPPIAPAVTNAIFAATGKRIRNLPISLESTLIELSSLRAVPSDREVVIIWETASEIDNAGFNLYRAESADGKYIQINDLIIPAEGFPTEGTSYQYVDDDVKNRKTYYYKLEDIDLNGTSTMHGPVSATPRLIYGIAK